jgi:hypothetical protein
VLGNGRQRQRAKNATVTIIANLCMRDEANTYSSRFCDASGEKVAESQRLLEVTRL